MIPSLNVGQIMTRDDTALQADHSIHLAAAEMEWRHIRHLPVVDASDDRLAALAERLPASASPDYGTPFYELFKRYDNDFYKIDPMLFSPAEVWLMSATSGNTFHGGRLAPDVLRTSLLARADG